MLLAGVALHGFDVLDDLAGIAAYIGNRILAGPGQLTHPAPIEHDGQQHQRYADQHHQAEFQVGE